MTRDEILKMEAGSEMDALIAEQVMGWVYGDVSSNGRTNKLWHPKDSSMTRLLNPLPYSTDIATAWEVVEKLRFSGYWIELLSHSGEIAYEVRFNGRGFGGYACETTVPLAICRAALLAVMDR